MSDNNDLRITIGGKTLVVSGGDSAEHMQKVADYVNGKLEENKKSPGYERMSMDTKTILLELNIGDDYITAKDKLDDALIVLAEKNKELYELKQELSSVKSKYEMAKNQVVELQSKAAETAAKIIKLETELKKK
ncbi:MAG: cell division protein ZapA [Lachnospiraceae bacterium]|nr:cell division protein ZapA [Lachnospiraceae bacterium]